MALPNVPAPVPVTGKSPMSRIVSRQIARRPRLSCARVIDSSSRRDRKSTRLNQSPCNLVLCHLLSLHAALPICHRLQIVVVSLVDSIAGFRRLVNVDGLAECAGAGAGHREIPDEPNRVAPDREAAAAFLRARHRFLEPARSEEHTSEPVTL